MKNPIIEDYMKQLKIQNNRSLICDSYICGDYNENSDIDILFLVKNHQFNMKLETYENILFDRIFADYNILKKNYFSIPIFQKFYPIHCVESKCTK